MYLYGMIHVLQIYYVLCICIYLEKKHTESQLLKVIH